VTGDTYTPTLGALGTSGFLIGESLFPLTFTFTLTIRSGILGRHPYLVRSGLTRLSVGVVG